MGTTTPTDTTGAPPPSGRRRLRHVGPGIVAAATGVGAGDLVATLVAGASFGTVLLWAAVLGTLLKIALGEAVGRWHVVTGTTVLDGWRRLGRWATTFFGVYIVLWGFVYGATAMSATGLPLNALFGGLSVRWWGVIAGVAGLALVWAQRYEVFEKVMTVLVGVMFVSVVTTAVLVAPDLGSVLSGLVPRLPDGSSVYVLGLVGGVGGTITMAAYGYWMFAKGWRGTGWLSMMRLDNAVGYVITGFFVIAMLVVGANLLAGFDITADDSGLLVLGDTLGQRFGDWARTVFLIGFLSASATSLLGVWNGVSYLFADWVRTVRLPHGRSAEAELAADAAAVRRSATSWSYRAYLLWLTFPPMLLLTFDRPFLLTVVYGVFGAAFMPFLAGTLLMLLNSGRVERDGRSGWLSNALLGAGGLLFFVLLVTDLVRRFG